MAFKLHQRFYECLSEDKNLISSDRVSEMESADKFYSSSLRTWPQESDKRREDTSTGVFFSRK